MASPSASICGAGVDALYAAPPRREGPVYAFLRDGWNGALDGARKAIGDIFAP